ncbi:MAG: V4R domain-containing protein [Conexivisphaera sp.]
MASGVPGRSFKVPLVAVEPGRRLAAVSLRVREPDLPAVASAIRSRIAAAGIRILGFACSADGDAYACVGLGDYTDAPASPAEVADWLSSIPGVLEVNLHVAPVDGFAAVGGLVLEAAGARAIVMSSRAFAGLLQGPREYLGEDAGASFVYYEGFFAGRAMGEYLLGFGRERALAMLPRIWEARGYAPNIEMLVDRDGSRYRFEARRLIECEVLSRYVKGRARTSHFFRGMVAGVLSTLEGGEWDVEEVECVNDGSDRCAFEARRRPPRGGGGASPE